MPPALTLLPPAPVSPSDIARTLASVPDPLGGRMLDWFRARNVRFDRKFYDVGALTPAEQDALSRHPATEGSLLYVPPGSGAIGQPASIDALAACHPRATALVVTGVGSSALGAAAFARNVADGLNQPVVAVVSGYGAADLMAEGAGGWFWFGTLNRMRHFLRRPTLSPSVAASDVSIGLASLTLSWLSPDTQTVIALLKDERFGFRFLAGHSKGNLVISEALFGLEGVAPARAHAVGQTATVITVSACIYMPPFCQTVIDIIGDRDFLGALNSNWLIPPDKVIAGASHSTDRTRRDSINVPEVLRELFPNP